MKNLLLILITALLLSFASALAANQGLKVAPEAFDLTGVAGQTIENVVRVSNPSNREAGVVASVEDFAPQGEEGGVEIKTGYKYGLSRYLSVSPKSFSLKPGELQYVTVTATIPKDAPAGARSGTVLFTGGREVTSSSGSTISGSLGVLLVLNIVGDAKDQAKLDSFTTKPVSAGPVDFDVRVENTGATVNKFQGTVKIHNVFGTKVAEVPLGPSNILPGAIRHFRGSWMEKNPAGPYRAELTGSFGEVKISSSAFFVGASAGGLGPVIVAVLTLLTLSLWLRKRNQ